MAKKELDVDKAFDKRGGWYNRNARAKALDRAIDLLAVRVAHQQERMKMMIDAKYGYGKLADLDARVFSDMTANSRDIQNLREIIHEPEKIFRIRKLMEEMQKDPAREHHEASEWASLYRVTRFVLDEIKYEKDVFSLSQDDD